MSLQSLYPIAPALALAILFFLGMGVFAWRVRTRGYPQHEDASRREATAIATPFFIRYVYWFLTPVENGLARLHVSPNTITVVSMALCAASGVAAATRHLALASWLYLIGGMLDTLDGRVARRNGSSSTAGAFFDSVMDRWAEFFTLGGIAFLLRDTLGLVAVLSCIMGSQMVSYTRARGEGLGIKLLGGTMQRAERMVVVGGGMLAAAIGDSTMAWDSLKVLSLSLLFVGVTSTLTAAHRLWTGMQELRVRDAAVTPLEEARDKRELRKRA